MENAGRSSAVCTGQRVAMARVPARWRSIGEAPGGAATPGGLCSREKGCGADWLQRGAWSTGCRVRSRTRTSTVGFRALRGQDRHLRRDGQWVRGGQGLARGGVSA